MARKPPTPPAKLDPAPPLVPMPLSVLPPPDAIEVEITTSKETWSEYQLQDGTRLRIRPVLVGTFRAPGQWMPDGEPVYGAKMTFIADVRAMKMA